MCVNLALRKMRSKEEQKYSKSPDTKKQFNHASLTLSNQVVPSKKQKSTEGHSRIQTSQSNTRKPEQTWPWPTPWHVTESWERHTL